MGLAGLGVVQFTHFGEMATYGDIAAHTPACGWSGTQFSRSPGPSPPPAPVTRPRWSGRPTRTSSIARPRCDHDRSLQWARPNLIGGYSFGDPWRLTGHTFPGGTDPGGRGVANIRLTAAPA
jgi:hypothetical protein